MKNDDEFRYRRAARIISCIKASPFHRPAKWIWQAFSAFRYHFTNIVAWLTGHRKPNKEEAAQVALQVTFIYKSFERQTMAKKLYRCIQRYYPGAKVIIADDSKIPLALDAPYAEVIHLPFNSGLSYGLNRALERVTTPFTVRMDDDLLLTPFTGFEKQLAFLDRHPEVDLVGVQMCTFPLLRPAEKVAKKYMSMSAHQIRKPLKIPHMTPLDKTHVVVGKSPNVFLTRTEAYRSIGYDDNIHLFDHHEFFYRAAGRLVSAMDVSASVFHNHNRFDRNYEGYRRAAQEDLLYIKNKHRAKNGSDNR